jgi:hypothetical protein
MSGIISTADVKTVFGNIGDMMKSKFGVDEYSSTSLNTMYSIFSICLGLSIIIFIYFIAPAGWKGKGMAASVYFKNIADFNNVKGTAFEKVAALLFLVGAIGLVSVLFTTKKKDGFSATADEKKKKADEKKKEAEKKKAAAAAARSNFGVDHTNDETM